MICVGGSGITRCCCLLLVMPLGPEVPWLPRRLWTAVSSAAGQYLRAVPVAASSSCSRKMIFWRKDVPLRMCFIPVERFKRPV